MSLPAKHDLEIYIGDDYSQPLQLQDGDGNPVKSTGSTFRAEIRERTEQGAVFGTFTVTVTDLSTSDLVLELPHATTKELKRGTDYFYDLRETDASGEKTTWLRGKVKPTQDVTRD